MARHRLLTDADHTLPDHAGLLSVIVAAVAASNAIDEEVLHKQIGPRVLERAKKSHDARLWNVAAFLAIPEQPEEQIRFEREALQATGDARFAGAVLYVKLARGQLAGSDPDLANALKQFPENGLVWRAAYEVAAKGNKVTKELLANAARAEFTHFSSFVAPATVVNRPRSDYLRSYFAQMRQLSAATRPADKG